MANCSLCGKPVGLFKSKHKECEQQQADGWTRMIAVATDAVRQRASRVDVRSRVSEIATASFVALSRVDQTIVRGWEQSAEHFLEDGKATHALHCGGARQCSPPRSHPERVIGWAAGQHTGRLPRLRADYRH
jgi:hypothetical protein